MKRRANKLIITSQPTETSCGHTCLHAIYAYYGYEYSLKQLIKEIPELPTGGTMAVHLATHALEQGFSARIYTYNISVFDPSWFSPKALTKQQLIHKLQAQMKAKHDAKLRGACESYIKYLDLGGCLQMDDLSGKLLLSHLRAGRPLLSGVSSTYLYQAARERVEDNRQVTDDVAGHPEGHFIVIERYDSKRRQIWVADPWGLNPISRNLRYAVTPDRLTTALLLGVLTYDANLLLIEPPADLAGKSA